MNKYDNARGARVTDALLNYETVKCFGNEELEISNLEKAILDYQRVEYKLMASLNWPQRAAVGHHLPRPHRRPHRLHQGAVAPTVVQCPLHPPLPHTFCIRCF